MSRTPSNPFPQLITSPDLGGVIAAELHEHYAHVAKQAGDVGAAEDLLWQMRLQVIRNAADQINAYHRVTKS